MSETPQAIPLTRGSNLSWPLTLTDSTGAAVNITGWTFAVVEVSPAALAASVSCVVTSGISGQALLTVPWSSSWPQGVGNLALIRLKPSGLDVAFPAILVQLQ